jgi:hypothetical protein
MILFLIFILVIAVVFIAALIRAQHREMLSAVRRLRGEAAPGSAGSANNAEAGNLYLLRVSDFGNFFRFFCLRNSATATVTSSSDHTAAFTRKVFEPLGLGHVW